MFNRLSLLLAVSFLAALAGCQPNVPSTMSTLPTADKMASASTQQALPIKAQAPEPTKATTLQWASNYHWQLTQVKGKKNNTININTANPITLAVAPSSLSLTQGCQNFAIDFGWMDAPPFEYGSRLGEKRSTCKNVLEDIKNETAIKALFPRDSTFKLGIEALPLSMNEPINTQNVPKNLVVTIENGNTLTFIGKPKAFKKLTGLPINKAVLERYDWRLVSAVHNTFDDNKQLTRAPIGDFYHPDYPVSLEFRNSPDGPYVAFNANCNGSSAPYFLLTDNTFKISNILSSAINCGKTGDRIETALFDLMRDSSSQLTLSLQSKKLESKKLESENQTDFPRYNLLQTFDSGETLVWQNKEKSQR